MHAQCIGVDGDSSAPRRPQLVLGDRDSLLCRLGGAQQCAGLIASQQQASAGVTPIGKGFVTQCQAMLYRELECFTISFGCWLIEF